MALSGYPEPGEREAQRVCADLRRANRHTYLASLTLRELAEELLAVTEHLVDRQHVQVAGDLGRAIAKVEQAVEARERCGAAGEATR